MIEEFNKSYGKLQDQIQNLENELVNDDIDEQIAKLDEEKKYDVDEQQSPLMF